MISPWQRPTYADPARTALAARDHLVAAVASLDDEPDPWRILKVASAAQYVLGLAGCRTALWRVVHTARGGGPAGQYPNALNLLCADHISTGHWSEADALVAEGLALCATSGLRLLEWTQHRFLAHAGRTALAAASGSPHAVSGPLPHPLDAETFKAAEGLLTGDGKRSAQVVSLASLGRQSWL